MKSFRTLCLTLCALATSLSALADVDFWKTFNFTQYDSERFRTRTHAQVRYPDLSFFQYFRISQQFFYKANDHLTLGIHPVYTDRRSSPNSEWRTNYRLDLEAHLSYEWNGIDFDMRNRYEIRQRVGSGSAHDRFRIRTNIRLPSSFLPSLRSITIGNEVFWNVDDGFINENRFVPVALNFSIGGSSWSPSFMIRSSREEPHSNWEQDYILGLTSSFKF